MKTWDQNTLLRFADGDLDAEEEATFVVQCELDPDGWREAVLAIVERRRLVEALREAAAVVPILGTSARPANGQVDRRRRFAKVARSAAVLAAGLLLGIVCTCVAFAFVNRAAPHIDVPLDRPAEVANVASKADEPSRDVESLGPFVPRLPEAQRTLLANCGVEVEEEPTLYLVTTENGMRYAIPTQRTIYRYSPH